MAPIKFEDNIREKLQERELNPSSDTWKKLEAQLGTPGRKKNTNRIWLAVAASLVTILVIGSLLMNRNTQIEEPFVDGDKTEEQTTQQRTNELATENAIQYDNEMQPNENALNQPVELSEKPKEVISEKKIDMAKTEVTPSEIDTKIMGINGAKNKAIEELVVVNKEEQEASKTDPLTITSRSLEELKLDEVVAQVQALQNKNKEVTPEEIDALLVKAQQDMARQRILNSDTRKVDAAALLSDVETEMERSFRDKVFDALGEGFVKVRTAVAERNN